ncbi:hypothetical protein K439DRAFT_1633170 [Ramaria rubella]|nr:hypothetical protein K439DRAFT_1633170 [Ramaria rubella]
MMGRLTQEITTTQEETTTTEIYPIADEKNATLPFFALVIGIDDYESVNKLTGAVADADDVARFLLNHLDVPNDHITNLRDASATRKNIVQAFHNLQANPAIDRDDAIFIYFAGHGSETEAPAGWSAPGSKIQVLLPQDTGVMDATDNPIPPIPDRTLAALLDNLAREKGNNITVVFDCCHASSGTRDNQNDRTPRTVKLPHSLPKDLDLDIVLEPEFEQGGRAINTPTVFLTSNLRSHILLAACGSEELAYENKKLGRGAFTTALIETLLNVGVDKLTYTGLMDRLPNLPRQNPQCEGHHRGRMLFNGKLPGAHRFFIGVEKHEKIFKLKAGNAQGITVDSEYTIHTSHILDSERNPALYRMRAIEVEPFRATLAPLDGTDAATLTSIPTPAYAREVLSGSGKELYVYFTDAFTRVMSVDCIRRVASAGMPDFGFIVTDLGQAELLVDIAKDTSGNPIAQFFTLNVHANVQGFKKLPHSVSIKPDAVSVVLRAAARWNFHLKRTNLTRFSGSVHIEFLPLTQLNDEFDEDGLQVLTPVGDDMNRTGVVDFVIEPDQYFGAKIVNKSNVDLYPYLFYFDASDQSIESYYVASTGKQRVDPPLRAGSEHTVGFGAGGEVPFAFTLREGEDLDIGFLKLFLTTLPMDFDSLCQPSPFDNSRGRVPRTDVIRKLKDSQRETEDWSTVITAIVQRSHPRPPLSLPMVEASPPEKEHDTASTQGWFTKVKVRLERLMAFHCGFLFGD